MANEVSINAETLVVTQSNVEYVPPDISALRMLLVDRLKTNGSSVIDENAPMFKQLNAALGIYTDVEVRDIINWIRAGRQAISEKEMQILLANTPVALDAIDVECDAIRARLQEILPTLPP